MLELQNDEAIRAERMDGVFVKASLFEVNKYFSYLQFAYKIPMQYVTIWDKLMGPMGFWNMKWDILKEKVIPFIDNGAIVEDLETKLNTTAMDTRLISKMLNYGPMYSILIGDSFITTDQHTIYLTLEDMKTVLN